MQEITVTAVTVTNSSCPATDIFVGYKHAKYPLLHVVHIYNAKLLDAEKGMQQKQEC